MICAINYITGRLPFHGVWLGVLPEVQTLKPGKAPCFSPHQKEIKSTFKGRQTRYTCIPSGLRFLEGSAEGFLF